MTNTTIASTPYYLTPINDLYGSVFTLTNASSGSTNFKYLTKLYYGTNEVTPDVQFLVKETQIPRPNTGYGIYSPYKSLLAVSGYDLNQGITSSVGGLGSADLLYYYINYGLQWNPELVWTTLLSVTSGTYSYFGFSFSSAHGLAVGDVITINTSNSYLAGTAAVTNTLFTTTRFSTDKIFVTASSTSIGSITNVERWNGTSSTYWGYNGTRQYALSGTDTSNSLIMGTAINVASSKGFLTDHPVTTRKSILMDQNETISHFAYRAGFSSPSAIYYTFNYYNSSNQVIGTYSTTSVVTGTNTLQKRDVPVGTKYLTTYGSMPASTSYYTLFVGRSIFNPTYSEVRTWTIDTDCSIYDNVRVMWLNSYGVFDYFNFRLDNKKTYNVSRTEYKQELPVPFVMSSRERTILSQKVEEQHTINTNFVSEDIYSYLGQLVISPEVYIINETTGDAYPVIITDSSYEYKTANRDKLFNMTLSYVYSYGIETQNQ